MIYPGDDSIARMSRSAMDTTPSPHFQDPPDLQRFIQANLSAAPVLGVPGIRLYQAGPRSGLWRLAGNGPHGSPYWAYPWAGGLALARHFHERPHKVAGRAVLDLGAGSGLVAIAAAKAGASEVIAADVDRRAADAIRLNAALNGVAVTTIGDDLTSGLPPAVDLVAVGDLFYESGLARRVTAFLDRCLDAGIEVLIGDPGRPFLPRRRLRLVAAYEVSGFGDERQPPLPTSLVFGFRKGSNAGPASGPGAQSSFSASSRNASGTARRGARPAAA
jgi:predicted nicotinamide N-methyase